MGFVRLHLFFLSRFRVLHGWGWGIRVPVNTWTPLLPLVMPLFFSSDNSSRVGFALFPSYSGLGFRRSFRGERSGARTSPASCCSYVVNFPSPRSLLRRPPTCICWFRALLSLQSLRAITMFMYRSARRVFPPPHPTRFVAWDCCALWLLSVRDLLSCLAVGDGFRCDSTVES